MTQRVGSERINVKIDFVVGKHRVCDENIFVRPHVDTVVVVFPYKEMLGFVTRGRAEVPMDAVKCRVDLSENRVFQVGKFLENVNLEWVILDWSGGKFCENSEILARHEIKTIKEIFWNDLCYICQTE